MAEEATDGGTESHANAADDTAAYARGIAVTEFGKERAALEDAPRALRGAIGDAVAAPATSEAVFPGFALAADEEHPNAVARTAAMAAALEEHAAAALQIREDMANELKLLKGEVLKERDVALGDLRVVHDAKMWKSSRSLRSQLNKTMSEVRKTAAFAESGVKHGPTATGALWCSADLAIAAESALRNKIAEEEAISAEYLLETAEQQRELRLHRLEQAALVNEAEAHARAARLSAAAALGWPGAGALNARAAPPAEDALRQLLATLAAKDAQEGLLVAELRDLVECTAWPSQPLSPPLVFSHAREAGTLPRRWPLASSHGFAAPTSGPIAASPCLP